MEDRLSALPDEILQLILAELPIRSQIETSHLSSRWRHLWSQNPVLRCLDWITPGNDKQDRLFFRHLLQQWRPPHILEIQADFTNFDLSRYLVDDVYGLHQENPYWYYNYLDNYLDYYDYYKAKEDDFIDLPKEWTDFAASSFLQHLSLKYRTYSSDAPSFAQYMQRGITSLKFLDLVHVRLTDGPPLAQYMESGLPSLNVLLLSKVNLTKADLDTLLSSCPLLQHLRLSYCRGIDNVVISSTSLKSLEVESYEEIESVSIVAAPSLVRLVSAANYKYHSPIVSIENKVPHLLCAILIRGLRCEQYHLMSVIPSISHVHVLSIRLNLLKELVEEYKIGESCIDLFGELKELHLTGDIIADPLLDVLHIFLRQRPSIEKFCLHLGDEFRGILDSEFSEDDGLYIRSPYAYHEYVGRVYESNRETPCFRKLKTCTTMTQLRIARVMGFMGTRNEMRLVKFLLVSARNLESLRVFCCYSIPKNLIEKLSLCPRASSKARLILAGEAERMDYLCKQTGKSPLYECWQVIERGQDVCICSKHPFPQYGPWSKIKSIYVLESESKREKAKWNAPWVQEEGWTLVTSSFETARRRKAPSIRRPNSLRIQVPRPSLVSTWNLFEALSTSGDQEIVPRQDIEAYQLVKFSKSDTLTVNPKNLGEEVRVLTPTIDLALSGALYNYSGEHTGTERVNHKIYIPETSSPTNKNVTTLLREEEYFVESEDEIEFKEWGERWTEETFEHDDHWELIDDDYGIGFYEDFKSQNTRKRRSIRKGNPHSKY